MIVLLFDIACGVFLQGQLWDLLVHMKCQAKGRFVSKIGTEYRSPADILQIHPGQVSHSRTLKISYDYGIQ